MDLALAVTDNAIPPKLIVFALFGGIWLLAAIFGKKKPTTIVPTTARRGANAPARTPAPPPMPAKPRARGKAKPQAVTVTQAAQLARQAAQQRPTVAAKSEVAPPLATPTRATTETARNLRLLLKRGGVREAFLMSEILSAPKSMRE